MDFVPVTEADAAPPSAAADALAAVALEILRPASPEDALPARVERGAVPALHVVKPAVVTGQEDALPARVERRTVAALHVVKPTVVTGQAVRSPVARPQLVSVVRGQPAVRGQARVVPVVRIPAGSLAMVPSLLMRSRQPSPEPTLAEVEAFRAQQLAIPVSPAVLAERSALSEDFQAAEALQDLVTIARSPSPSHPHDDHNQLPPSSEPQLRPLLPLQTQTQPLSPAGVRAESGSPADESEHHESPAADSNFLLEPTITLSCGDSYAAAMNRALEGDKPQTDDNTTTDLPVVEADSNAMPAATTVGCVMGEEDEDDMPLAVRRQKSSARGKKRKRARSSSEPAEAPSPQSPPAPFPCDDCEERFVDRLALAAHERDHGSAVHPCGVCPQTFTQALALRRHKLRHGQPQRSRVGRRHARAPSRYLDASWGELGIRRNRGGVRLVETVTCGVCDEELTPKEASEHLAPPPGVGFFRCAQCGEVFGQRCQLSRHGCRRLGNRRGGVRKAKRRRGASVPAAAPPQVEAERSGAESPDDDCAAQDSGSDWELEERTEPLAVATAADTSADGDDPSDADKPVDDSGGAGEGRLNCDVCQINFVSRRNLLRHRAQHEDGTRYSCEVCEQSYGRIDDLTRHTRSAHNQKRQFRCPRCMRMFTQKRIVEYHLRTHDTAVRRSRSARGASSKDANSNKTESNQDVEASDPPGPGPIRYTCEHCGLGFDTRRRYNRHQQLRHGAEVPRYECELCDASYARVDELTRHSIQIHHQKKTVPCPRCTRLFTQQRIVDYHMLGHDTKRVYMKTPRPYQCNQCPRKYRTEAELTEHVCRNKASTQRCVCDICGRGISCPQALRRHRLQHNEERPAKCDTCGAGFIDELALSKHVLTHSEEKPYLCDHCGKGFRFKDYLVRHTRFHTGERPYQCSVCEKRFATSDTLGRHFLIHTGAKPFVCKLCSRPFRQAQQLKTHMKVHRKHEAPPFLGQQEVAETIDLRLYGMTGGDERLGDNAEKELRLEEAMGGEADMEAAADTDVRLVEQVPVEARYAKVEENA